MHSTDGAPSSEYPVPQVRALNLLCVLGFQFEARFPRSWHLGSAASEEVYSKIPALTYHIYKTIFIRNQYLRNQYKTI
jgi:hypothetical protein